MSMNAAKLQLTLQEREHQIASLAALGATLADMLELLLLTVEAEFPGDLMASVLLLDEGGRRLIHGAAPSLPHAYREAINGVVIGPNVGSCGTAAYLGEPVYVSDIASDPLWVDFREIALAHNLRACWSTPIKGSDGRLLGTFAIYHPTPRLPSPNELARIGMVTQTVAEAIERYPAAGRSI